LAPGGRHTFWLAALALLALLLAGRAARAQAPVQPCVTNGAVNAAVRSDTTLYLGGSFPYVGPSIVCGPAVAAGPGAPNLAYANPKGWVRVAVPDGVGG